MKKLMQRTFRNVMTLFICFVSVLLAVAPAVSCISGAPVPLTAYATDEETAAEEAEDTGAAAEEKKDSKETSAKTVENDSGKEAPRKDSDNEAPKEEPKGDQGRSSDAENAADTQKSLAEKTLTADGSDYHISVSGMLPEGTRLEASEIEKKKQLSELEKEAAEKIFEDDKLCDADSLPYARFFDISIIDKDGNEYEPEDKVSLSIDLKDDALETKDVDITAVHFDKKAGAELIPVDIDGSTASLEAESFSTYGVVYSYTVDFYYAPKDGKESEYHMNGGSEMMLSDLFDKLGISRKTSDIKSLEFTDESLVSFTKERGDYRIKSLRPFTTGEQLTVNFTDGTVITIKVEDATYKEWWFGAGKHGDTRSSEIYAKLDLETGKMIIRPKDTCGGATGHAYFHGSYEKKEDWKWDQYRDAIKEVEFQGTVDVDPSYDIRLNYMFADCKNLTKVSGLGSFDTTYVYALARMFSGCTSLRSVDISPLKNGSYIQNMQNMFNGCTALETVIMPGEDFKVGKDALLAGMFEGCTSLTSVVFNGMDVSKAKTMTSMFKDCKALKTLDVSTFGTLTNIVNMDGFVEGCTALEELDISNLDNSVIKPQRALHKRSDNLDYGRNLGINTESTPALKKLTAVKSKVYMCKNRAGSPDLQYYDASYEEDVVYFTDKQAEFTPKSGGTPVTIETRRDYIDLITARSENGGRGKDGHSESSKNKMYGLNTNGAGFLAPGTYVMKGAKRTDPEPANLPATRYRITEMGKEGTDPKVEVLNDWNGLLKKDGDIIETDERSRSFWGSSGDHTIGDGTSPLIKITYPKVATDFYGTAHDVVLTVNKITFRNIGNIPKPGDAYTARKHNTNLYAGDSYYRTVLEAKSGTLDFRNYVYSTDAKRWWNNETGEWTAVPGDNRVLSNGSGTYIDFDISIPDAPEGSTLMFYINDLDIPASQTWTLSNDMCYDDLPWSGVTYEDGSEGMILGSGNDLDTLTFADHTGLQIIDRNHVVATGSDPSTSWSEFYVQAAATGAKYTWTSGVGCTTYLLKNTDPPAEPDPVKLRLEAEKYLAGRAWDTNDKFDIAIRLNEEDTATPVPEGEDVGELEEDDYRYYYVTIWNNDTSASEDRGRKKAFGEITYTIEDMKDSSGTVLKEKTFVYPMEELKPGLVSDSIEGITYSNEEYEARVKVVIDESVPDKPALKIDPVTYKKKGTQETPDTARFTNTYKPKEIGYTMRADKDFHDVNRDEGIALEGDEFEFALKPAGKYAAKAPMPEGSSGEGAGRVFTAGNDDGGEIRFQKKPYDNDSGLVFNYEKLIEAGISAEELHSEAGVTFEYEMYEIIPEAGKDEVKTNNGNSTWSITNTKTGVATVHDGIHHIRKLTVRADQDDRLELIVQKDSDTDDFFIDKDGTKRSVSVLEGYNHNMYHMHADHGDGYPVFVNFRFRQKYADIRVKKEWNDRNNRDGIRPSSVEAVIKSDAFVPLDETLTLKGLFWSAVVKDQPVWKFDVMHDETEHGVHSELIKVRYTLAEKQGGVINGDVNTGYAANYDFDSPFTLDEDGADKVLTITNTHVPEDMYLVTYEDGDHGKSDGGSVIRRYGEKPQKNNVTPANGYRFTGRYKYVITNKAGEVIDSGMTDDPLSITVTGNIVFTPFYEPDPDSGGQKGGGSTSGTNTGDPNGTGLMIAVIGLGAGLSGLVPAIRSRRKRGKAV